MTTQRGQQVIPIRDRRRDGDGEPLPHQPAGQAAGNVTAGDTTAHPIDVRDPHRAPQRCCAAPLLWTDLYGWVHLATRLPWGQHPQPTDRRQR